jgi:predicted PurR-regulated permease PerM
MDQANWQRNRDILISIICIGIILWAIWNIGGIFVDTIIILLLSMGVAFLLTPLVNALTRYRLPRVAATLLVYIIVLLTLGAFGYALVTDLVQQILTFSTTVTNFAVALPTTLRNFINFIEVQGKIPDSSVQAAISQIQSQATDFARSLATNTLSTLLILTSGFLNFFLITVLSFYITVDGKRMRDSLISIVPKSWLPHMSLFEDALNRVVGNYIRGQLTLAVIVGVLAALVCIGVGGGMGQFALIVGALGFLFETIPMVGPGLASIPAILISLLLPNPFPRTFIVIACFVIIQLIESNILGPRIVGHAVGLHPVASILSLLVGARLFGAFGALLATPIVAAAWVVVSSLYRSARGETPDQILSKRRAPWSIRRPTIGLGANRGKTEGPPGKQAPSISDTAHAIGSHTTPTPRPTRPRAPETRKDEHERDHVQVHKEEPGEAVGPTERPTEHI